MASRHKEWLEGPASLLITKQEREAFQALRTEEQRDQYIERFWELRNPKLGSAANEFKEEFFSRVAYANAFYGNDAGVEGWRTDRGRAYILFGKPQTSLSFLAHQELYPTEMWFYSNPGLSELPPFFYVLFFERDGVSGYRLYNPVADGPDKLMRAGPAKAQAYNYLRQLNPELAAATLTLVPGDMADTESYSGSLASLPILNAVRNYSEMPSYRALITERARRLERVSSRVTYDVPETQLSVFVVQEEDGPWAHWRMEIHDPLRPKIKNGRWEFTIRAQLHQRDQMVYERNDAPSFGIPEAQWEAADKRPFAYEDCFPVCPGDYRLVVWAVNRAADRSYEAEARFTAAEPAGRTHASELLIAGRASPDTRPRAFQFRGSKFDLLSGGRTQSAVPLYVVYQVKGERPEPVELTAEYVIGSASGKLRKTIEDKVNLAAADAAGRLLVARTLPIDDLSPGQYLLALRLRNPRTGEVVGRSAKFAVVSQGDPRPIVAARPAPAGPRETAAAHYERALCWLAQGRAPEALREAEASWRVFQTPAARQLLDRLSAAAGRMSNK